MDDVAVFFVVQLLISDRGQEATERRLIVHHAEYASGAGVHLEEFENSKFRDFHSIRDFRMLQ